MADPKNDFNAFPVAGSGAPAKPTGFEQFPESGVSAGSAKGAALEAAGRGFLESAGIAGGIATGVGLGMMAAPFAGPAAPAMPVVGGVAGAAYGAFAGSQAAGGLGLRSPEQMPPELRPAAYFGESVGGAGAFMAAPYAVAATGLKFGSTMVGTLLNDIVTTAKTTPWMFGAAEVSSAASAGTGAYMAEKYAPGKTGVRIGAETALGIANPSRLVIDGAGFAWRSGKQLWASASGQGRQTAAGKMLDDLFRVTGEDPAAIARILKTPGVLGDDVKLTSAQLTGSKALTAMEDWLAKQSSQFGMESGQKARDGLDAIRYQIGLFTRTGDPQMMQAAAQARSVYFRTLVQGRVDGALSEAGKAAAKITTDSPEARAQLSNVAHGALTKALGEARTAEKQMWDAVDGTRKVNFENLQKTYDDNVAELLPEVRNQKLPTIVRDFLARVSAPKEGQKSLIILPENVSRPQAAPEMVGTTVSEMRQLRGELLDLSRSSTNAGEYGQARIYSELAEAVLDDMDVAFRGAGDTAYDTARSFSREFNDVFTRSFAGKAMSTGRYGDRIAPELMLRKALSTGKEAGSIQLQELEEATRFMQTRGLGSDEAMRDMLDAQERFIRLAAADSIDPLSGRIDPKRVSKFMKDNELLLKRFPEVKNDLTLATTSEQAARRMENLATNQVNVVMKQKTFARMLSSDPVTMASKAILSTNQEQELKYLIDIAKGGYTPRGGGMAITPKDAQEGLTASIYDAVIRRSTDKNGVLNLSQTKSLLFSPSVPGQKSPIQVLQENGLVDAKHVTNLKKLFDQAESITRSMTPGTAVEVKSDAVDFLMVALSKMVGSTVAGGIAKAFGSSTPSLIVHGAGARLAEQTVTKLPTQSAQKFLVEAANSPDKLALLLEKVKDPAKQAAQMRQIHAWLVQSNLVAAENALAPTYEQRPEQPQFFSQPR